MHFAVITLSALVAAASAQSFQQPLQTGQFIQRQAVPVQQDFLQAQLAQQRTVDESNGFQEVRDGYGQHSASWTTPHGAAHTSHLALRTAGEEGPVPTAQGAWKWIDRETGKEYLTKYYADENGFHAEGDHLPRAPVDPNNPIFPAN